MSPAVRALLAAVAVELSALRERVEDLSDLVADHVRAQPPGAREAALVQAQSVDETTQTLDALSVLLAAVSQGVTPETAVAAAPLAGLAARLSGASPVAPNAVTDGDLMLFE